MSIGNSNIHQVSEIPEITKLPNGRLRVIRRFNKFTREDVDNANLGSLMGDFGDLDTTGEQIVNQGYTNLRLISVEVDNRFNAVTNNSNPVLVKTYETLTNAFVQVTDEDQIEELENGTKRITRVLRAQSGTTYDGDVGTTNAGGSNTTFILAKSDLKDSGAFAELTLTFLEPVILSRTDDKSDPACPITIVAFDKDETDSGIFASENAEIDSDDYVLVSKTERDFEGIETFEMRFEKREYFLQEKENEFGRVENVKVEQGGDYELATMPGTAGTVNGTQNSYIIAQEITEGIVPKRITTFSTAGIESVSEDLIGSTKVITITTFITAPSTNTAQTYSNDTTDTANDFILISDTNNRVNGVDVFTYKYAKNNAVISTSEDLVGSQKSFVIEKFGDAVPENDDVTFDLSEHSVARKEVSNVEGIKTFRYTFLKPSILSVQEDKNTPANRYTVRAFDLEYNDDSIYSGVGTPVVSGISHVFISSTEENYEGIKTSVYVFESRDYHTETKNEFGRTIIDRVEYNESNTLTLQSQSSVYNLFGYYGLRILNQTIENNDNEVNKRITRYTTVGIDEVREDKIGSQNSIIITKVGAEPTTSEASQYSDIGYDSSDDWSIARKDNSRVSGLDVYTYTFLLDNSILSQSEDKIGSQNAIVSEVYNPDVTIEGIEIEGGNNVAGQYLRRSGTYNGKPWYSTGTGQYDKYLRWFSSYSRWEINVFNHVSSRCAQDTDTPPTDPTLWIPDDADDESDFIHNLTLRHFDTTEIISGSVSSYHLSDQYQHEGYTLANVGQSNIDGIPTVRFTYLKPSILSVANEFSTSRNIVRVQAFNQSSAEVTSALSEVTSNHKLISQEETDHDGIATTTYTYVLDEYDAISYTTTGLLNVTRTSYEVANYDYTSAGDDQLLVGTDSITVNGKTLYLQNFDVENGTTCTRLVKTYVEYGVLNKTERLINEGVKSTTYQYLGSSVPTEVSTLLTNGIKISESVNRKLGIPLTTVVIYTDKDGNSLTNANGAEKLNYQYHQISPFILPGVVDLVNEHNHVFPKIQSPVETRVNAQVQIFYQTSAELDESSTGDFYKKKVDSSLSEDTTTNQGFWSPREFAQKESHVDAFIDDNGNLKPAYYNSQGIRGVRTRESSKVSGVEIKTFPYNYRGGINIIEDVGVDETTETLNGKQVYLRTYPFTFDIVHTVNVHLGVVLRGRPTEIRGETNFRIAYNVDSNYANKWVIQTKTLYTGAVGVYDYYGSVRRAFQSGTSGEWQRTRPFRPTSDTDWVTQGYSASNADVPWEETWTSLIKEIDSSEDNFGASTYTEFTTKDDFTTTQAISNPLDQFKTITFTEPTRVESFGFGENRATSGSNTVQTINLTTNSGTTVSLPQAGFFLEGRQVDNGATGRIEIKGGPPNPLGKRYTLDVQIQRAFDDIDGTAYYMKKVVIADINPIGIE